MAHPGGVLCNSDDGCLGGLSKVFGFEASACMQIFRLKLLAGSKAL